MLKTLKTNHGDISLPTFFPDATRGVVKGGLDTVDLSNTKVEGIVINTLHLRGAIREQFNCHLLMNWTKPIITDSGGFQVMSLIHHHPKLGKLTDNEAIFIDASGQKIIFTPEASIQLQLKLGADILICLDDCTDPESPLSLQEKSVERTINWARRCKIEFDKLTSQKNDRPLRKSKKVAGAEHQAISLHVCP